MFWSEEVDLLPGRGTWRETLPDIGKVSLRNAADASDNAWQRDYVPAQRWEWCQMFKDGYEFISQLVLQTACNITEWRQYEISVGGSCFWSESYTRGDCKESWASVGILS
jgi:hypothetical protein